MTRLASIFPSSFKPALWEWLSRQMHLNHQLPSGIRIRLSSYSDWCIYNDIFVAGEYDEAIHLALDKALAKQVFRVVDLGANVGFFTLRVLDLIARRHMQFERVECLLVEASARLRPFLQHHLDGCQRKDVSSRIVIGLVGLRSGTAQFELAGSECMNHITTGGAPKARVIPYFDLYDALDEASEIGLLKCDIEGAEQMFIENYPRILEKSKVAAFEFHAPQCPAEVGIGKVMAAGFAANRLLHDQGHAKTI